MIGSHLTTTALCCLGLLQAAEIPLIPAHELNRRTELSGREILVEGRSPRFSFERGRGWNTFEIEGAAVKFRLNGSLSYEKPPTTPVIRARGIMQITPGGMVVTVTRPPELLPTDNDRLETAVAALPQTDYKTRARWAEWATGRAQEYKDEPLLERARTIAGDAIRIEADLPGSAAPALQLELARKARQLKVPEPVPTSLIHRALRSLAATATTANQADQLLASAQSQLPETARSPQPAPLDDWTAPYEQDPASTYRRADAPTRAALDRKLLADLTQKAFELHAQENPDEALALAARAETALPDRPRVTQALLLKGLERTDVRSLTLAEVQDRARLFASLGEQERSSDLLHSWLESRRREHLGTNDAEGRLELADQFESLLQDRRSAESLLREAWKIAPDSEAVAAAFRRRGYTQLGTDWVAPSDTSSDTPAANTAATPALADPYRGLSRPEVLQRLGEPDSVARVATQGQVREQWIYRRGRKEALYLNFLQRVGIPTASVISSHNSPASLP